MSTISKDFTAVGVGATLMVRRGESYTYDVAGTFEGTVRVETSKNGGNTWESQVSATEAADGTLYHNGPETAILARFRCTVFTSGTIETELADVAEVAQSFVDQNGVAQLEILEGSVNFPVAAAVNGVSVVTTTGTQTLTGKTLTAPTVNSPVIDSPTITGNIILEGTTADAHETTIVSEATGSDKTITLPDATDTLVGRATTDTLSNKTLAAPVVTGAGITITPNATDALIGAVAVAASGIVAVAIERSGSFFKLDFTLILARVPVTDDGANGSFGALKLFDFAEGSFASLGCRQNYTAYVEGALLTGEAGDAVFEIGLGTTEISAAADGVLGAANKNIGKSIAQTLSGGTTTGNAIDGPGESGSGYADGTAAAAALWLNWSGTAATIDATDYIDVSGTISVVGVLLGDD